MTDLIQKARALDKFSIGRLISDFEDSRATAATRRHEIVAELDAALAADGRAPARILGFTGTPGAGKSTLVGTLAGRMITERPELRVAVLAVDPSSQVSGGALLGDRTRVRFPLDEKRLFFRSQSSDREMGGLGRNTFQVVRLLRLLFDYILVETVGIGQSEIEIQHLGDRIYLVLQPLGGDQVQFMKAGIMEIPDAVILNKADEKAAAEKSFHALQASLAFARPGDEDIPLFRTSAHSGLGLDELLEDMHVRAQNGDFAIKEAYFFRKWVRDEFGRRGLVYLDQLQTDAAAAGPDGRRRSLPDKAGSFDLAQIEFETGYQVDMAGAVVRS